MSLRIAPIAVVLLAACSRAEAPATREDAQPERGSREWLVQTARSAAPEAISATAAVVAMRDSTMALDTLEPASAGSTWTCFADDTTTQHEDPVCADAEAMKWFAAWSTGNRQGPRLAGMGVVYALRGGAVPSDTDPYMMRPDSGGMVMDGPSIYIAMPNTSAYQGLPTTRRSDGPWVRYAGTPYAYIVLPAGNR